MCMLCNKKKFYKTEVVFRWSMKIKLLNYDVLLVTYNKYT